MTLGQETQTMISNRTNYLKEKALGQLAALGWGKVMETVPLANLVNGQVQEVADEASQDL